MAETAKPCEECHTGDMALFVETSPIKVQRYKACSYIDAMHGLCVTCHKEIAERIGRPRHGLCRTCHPAVLEENDLTEWERRTRRITSHRWVVSVPLLPENIDLERLRRAVSMAK